jgi:GNAT superfamily N-acetyltransferase
VDPLLDNPVFNALLTGEAARAHGTEKVKWFDEEVSPFAGIQTGYDQGFADLYDLLPAGRRILYATPSTITEPHGWKLMVHIPGLQFTFDPALAPALPSERPVPLGKENVEEMIQLAELTKPGPFGKRTIEFGHYHGIFREGRLAAMTGQRLHVAHYTEVSAVCTHPDFLGQGFAATLLQHQLHLICRQGQVPFLHVRDDNARAIALYKRLGFTVRGPMHFYYLKRRAEMILE